MIKLNFKQYINELYYDTLTDEHGVEHKIFVNPITDELHSQLKSIRGLRGLLSKEGDVYIWDLDAFSHESISAGIKKHIHIGFYIFPNFSKTNDAPFYLSYSGFSSTGEGHSKPLEKLFTNSKIQRMIGQKDFEPVYKLSLNNAAGTAADGNNRHLKYPTSAPTNKWRQLVDKKVLNPGQKWWALNSESNLNELYYSAINCDDETKVYINPSYDEMLEQLRKANALRGILDKKGDIYIWNEDNCMHKDTACLLNIEIHVGFYIRKIYKPTENDPEFYITYSNFSTINKEQTLEHLLANPKIQRMIGRNNFEKVMQKSMDFGKTSDDRHIKNPISFKPADPEVNPYSNKNNPGNIYQQMINKRILIPGQKLWALNSENSQ